MKAVLINIDHLENPTDDVVKRWSEEVDLPDDSEELLQWLENNHYELVRKSGPDCWGIAVRTDENALEKAVFIYRPELYGMSRPEVYFGSVLIWSTEKTLTERQVVDFGARVSTLPDHATLRDLVRPIRSLKCYCCGNPVSTYDENMQPYCLECHMVALPPGVSLEKHMNRAFWNQPRFGCDIYPVAARKILQEKFKNHMGGQTEKEPSND